MQASELYFITDVTFEVVAEWVCDMTCMLIGMHRSSSVQMRKCRDGSSFFFAVSPFHCATSVQLPM
jgi:hypothetical protein